MVDIARGLAERGLSVDLVAIQAEGPFLDLVPPDVRLVNLGTGRAHKSLPALIGYLRRRCPCVLMATLPQASVVAGIAVALRDRSIPLVLRRASHFSMELANSRLKHRWALSLELTMLPYVAAVVVNSSGVAADLRKRARRSLKRLRVIHNPVVWPDHAELAAAPVEERWFEDPLVPVVVSVGRLAPPKDHATLLSAFAEVIASRPARLVLLGLGPERDVLSDLVEELEITPFVEFAGFRLNPFAYMSKARVVVLSSRYEGSPNVLIQAMACGTQVVSTDCPTGPREILESGKWGRLVPVGDARALASAIVQALDDPGDFRGLTARANDYSAESSITAYLQVLRSAVSRGK